MACKQGIRKGMEVSKIRAQELRLEKPDPFGAYGFELMKRAFNTPGDFQRLSPQEQTYCSVSILGSVACTEGMHEFFLTKSGDYYREALRGLEEMGAWRVRELLLAACRLLFKHDAPPRNTATRRAKLARPSRALEKIDAEFCANTDELIAKLHDYALKHHLVRPEA